MHKETAIKVNQKQVLGHTYSPTARITKAKIQ
jgi:hypothetical protein